MNVGIQKCGHGRDDEIRNAYDASIQQVETVRVSVIEPTSHAPEHLAVNIIPDSQDLLWRIRVKDVLDGHSPHESGGKESGADQHDE